MIAFVLRVGDDALYYWRDGTFKITGWGAVVVWLLVWWITHLVRGDQ